MATKPTKLPDYLILKNVLLQSTIQKTDPAIFQILAKLLDAVGQSQQVMVDTVIPDSSAAVAETVINNLFGNAVPKYRSDIIPFIDTTYETLVVPRNTLREFGTYIPLRLGAGWQQDNLAGHIGSTNVATGATNGPANASNRYVIQWSASGAPANTVSLRGSANPFSRMQLEPFFEMIWLQQDVVGVVNPLHAGSPGARLWIVLADIAGGNWTNADAQGGRFGVGLRYSTAAGDTGWKAWSGNGAGAQTLTLLNPLITPALSTVYTISIRVINGGTSAVIKVNNSQVTIPFNGTATSGTSMTWMFFYNGGSGSNWVTNIGNMYIESFA